MRSLQFVTSENAKDFLVGLATQVKNELKRIFSNIQSVPLFALATLLDPRLKKVAFTSVSSSSQGKTHSISEMSPSVPSMPTHSVDYNKEFWKKFDDIVAATRDH